VITGVLVGLIARKLRSLPLGILFGLLIGLVLAYIVAALGDGKGHHYYWEIMLPGSLLGAIVGYATQRYGRAGNQTARA